MVIIIPFLTTMGTERGGRARLLRRIVPLLINNYGDSCMNFKKKGLALAVATAAAATGSVMVQAGTWAPSTTATGPEYAAEIFGAGNTTTIDPTTARYTLAAGVTAGAQVIDVTLTGGTFGAAAPTMAYGTTGDNDIDSNSDGIGGNDTTNGIADSVGAATATLVSGGGTTDSTAQFRVATTTALEVGDSFTLTYQIQGVTGLSAATTTAGPTLAFTITDALGAVDTAGAAGVVGSSAEAITATVVADATPDRIDVTAGSTLFTTTGGGATNTFDLGGFTITDNGTSVEDDGTTNFTVNAGNATLTSASLTLAGDFAAAVGVDADTNTATNDGLAFAGCGVTANATTLAADSATFTLTAANVATIAAQANECSLTMTVDGTTLLNTSAPTATLSIDYAGVGYADESVTGALTAMAKNGSSATLNLLLNPAGAYDNFVRVTNGGTVAGAVFVTMLNDSGDSVTFNFNSGASLAAGASSDLVSIDTLYADAQAADATFDVGTGKLRATFEGEFSGIDVQNISVSTDGTTFFTF